MSGQGLGKKRLSIKSLLSYGPGRFKLPRRRTSSDFSRDPSPGLFVVHCMHPIFYTQSRCDPNLSRKSPQVRVHCGVSDQGRPDAPCPIKTNSKVYAGRMPRETTPAGCWYKPVNRLVAPVRNTTESARKLLYCFLPTFKLPAALSWKAFQAGREEGSFPAPASRTGLN